MDKPSFDELLRSLPFIKDHPKGATWIFGSILCVILLILAGYHVFGISRDDIYVTHRIDDTPLFVTAPQTTHAEAKVYRLFIHTGDGVPNALGTTLTPTSTVATNTLTPTPGRTTTFTITGVSGIVLSPQQTLTFTFTPQLYHVVDISYTNDFSSTNTAIINLLFESGGEARVELDKEHPWLAPLRRLFVQSLSGIVLTTVVPVLLFVIAGLATIHKKALDEELEQLKRAIVQIVKLETAAIYQRDLETLEARVSALSARGRELNNAHQSELESVQNSLDFCHLLSLLRLKDFDKADRLINKLKSRNNFVDEKIGPFLTDVTEIQDERHFRSINSNAPFLNERLAWLQYKRVLDNIPLETTKDLIKAKARIDPIIFDRLRKHITLSERAIPPKIPSQDQVYLEPLGLFVPYYILSGVKEQLLSKDKMVFIVGSPGSGKTATLYFLQNAECEDGVVYLPTLEADALSNNPPLTMLATHLVRALLHIFAQNTYLWSYLAEELQSSDRAIDKVLQRLELDAQSEEKRALSRLVALGEIMTSMKMTTVCVAIDNAPDNIDYVSLRSLLGSCLSQEVRLRIAFKNTVFAPSSHSIIQLKWKEADLEALLENITQCGPQWGPSWVGDVHAQFLKEIKVPRDMLVWLVALRTSYPDKDVTPERWYILREAMRDARKNYRPDATDWVMADWYAAQKVLRL